jgi:hypothetical protein
MKRWYGLLLPVLFSASFLGGYAAPQDRQYVDYFLRLQAADLFRKKSFLLNWSCASVNCNRLLGVDLCFSCYKTLSINQARKLLVEVAEEIVDKINNDPSLHERGMLPEPFTLNQIYLKIETDNVFSAQADMETVQVMYLDRGHITYYSYPASTLFYGRVTKFEESLEQARMILGENIPFAGAPAKPKEEEKPVPAAPEVPKEIPPVRTIEPSEEVPMTPLQEERRVVANTDNMLEERTGVVPAKEQLWEENFLGSLFEQVTDSFPALRNDREDQRDQTCHLTIPVSSFPNSTKTQSSQHLAVEDICYAKEGLVTEREEQRWTVASLPEHKPVSYSDKQVDSDRPLQDSVSIPYSSIAVASSSLPEKQLAPDQRWLSDTAEEVSAASYVAYEPDVATFVAPSPTNKEIKNDLPARVDGQNEVFSVVAEEPAQDEMRQEPKPSWYQGIMNWFKKAPKETAESKNEEPSVPNEELIEPENEVQEEPLPSSSRDEEVVNSQEKIQVEDKDGSSQPERSPSASQSPSFFKRIASWFRDSTDKKPSSPQEPPVADICQTAPLNPLNDNSSEDKIDLETLMDNAKGTPESRAEDNSKGITGAEESSPSKGFSEWLHVSPRTSSQDQPLSSASVPQELSSGKQKIAFAKDVVSPPEVIDETQDDEIEVSSMTSGYQKFMNWLHGSEQAPGTLTADAETISSDENEAVAPSDPWYKNVIAMFKGAPDEKQGEGPSPSEEGIGDDSKEVSSEPAFLPSRIDDGKDNAKSWVFVAPREKIPEPNQEPSVEEPDHDENSSWMKRFSNWIHGDTFKEESISPSDLPEQQKTEEKEGPDNGSYVAARLGEVDRPDEAWEDIEQEMQDEDENSDDEMTRPGILARTFSAIHSLWQSAVKSVSSSEKMDHLDESTASCSVQEESEDSGQPT